MKTYSVKASDIKREWHVIDVSDKILGRVATEIAVLLMGKHKPMFVRNADCGDYVIVTNADKVQVTGKKPQLKMYYRHSNYPGGFKSTSYEKMMQTHPERIIHHAVAGMLPHNHMSDQVIKRLKVYTSKETPDLSQVKSTAPKPEEIKKE